MGVVSELAKELTSEIDNHVQRQFLHAQGEIHKEMLRTFFLGRANAETGFLTGLRVAPIPGSNIKNRFDYWEYEDAASNLNKVDLSAKNPMRYVAARAIKPEITEHTKFEQLDAYHKLLYAITETAINLGLNIDECIQEVIFTVNVYKKTNRDMRETDYIQIKKTVAEDLMKARNSISKQEYPVSTGYRLLFKYDMKLLSGVE